ncbi:MAG: hypothetical protein HYY28_08295 [Betaproteobacteria bacterium]|nr:hypothetical protein [Betaproteobacteria bacterium]
MLLNVVAFVAAGLALWYPRPYMLVISVLAFLPWVALALLADSRKLYSLFNDQEETRAGLEILLSIPGFALAFRAIDDAQVLEWEPALKMGLLGGVLLTCCAAILEPAIRRTWVGLLILFIACWYAFGALTLARGLGDRSAPRVYRTAVLEKQASSGKVVNRKLMLEPWGARATPEYAHATREVFDSVRPGDRVCVDLYRGLLAIPWFQVRSCD